MQAVERNGTHKDYLNCTLQMNSFTGWTPPSAVSRCLNLLSGQKSAFCPSEKTMNWIEKWLASLMMGTTSSTTMQSLGRSNSARRL